MTRFTLRAALVVASLVAWDAPSAQAQSDRLYDTSGNNVSGAVAQTSARGVQIKKGNNVSNFASGDIEKILYEGDPAALTQAREFAIDGQYDQALTELQKIDMGSIKRDVIEADVAFYIALSQAKLALAGKKPRDAAARTVLAFATKYRDSWHFYDAAKLAGDLALALNNPAEATKYYKLLAGASSVDTKLESVYLQSLVLLKQNQSAEAIAELDKIIGYQAQTPASLRTQILSKAAKAVALAQGGKADEGLGMVKELIAELNPTDIEMSARIYNAQGASYEAAGDNEGAVLAYLHTHLMFSGMPDAHSEALLRLVDLWPKVGKPARAAEARQELQQRYPGAL